jgi:plastocyanin
VRTATFAAVLGLALCTGGGAAGDQSKPRTYTITMEGMRFQPEVLALATGDTVVWVNKDLVPHTATSKAGGFDSKVIAAAESWRYTVRKKGDIPYICTFHPMMKGLLRVK